MADENLGQVGRIRVGRVDTGTQIFNNVAMTSAELLRRALTNACFGLDEIHWFEKRTENKQTKFVVNCAYTADPEKRIKGYDEKTTQAVRELAKTPWFCHVWLNPNGVLTINFVGMQSGEARNLLSVRGNELVLIDVHGAVTPSGVNLDDVDTVLVKFFFTNKKRIPAGIEKKERASDAEMDARHAAEVSQ